MAEPIETDAELIARVTLDGDRRRAERQGGNGDVVPLGSWHWLRVKSLKKDDDVDAKGAHERLVCVTKLGSNYARIETPDGSYWRLHLENEFPDVTRPCPDHRNVIDRALADRQAAVTKLLGEVQRVTAQLGMQADGSERGEAGTALAVLSGTEDPDAYKRALVKAKDKVLPELFKRIEAEHEALATWMKADLLPIIATAKAAEGCIKEVEGRIFNVEIYAGLSEEVKEVAKGSPAASHEKLRVFQNTAFMDEEALFDYRAGGMDFKRIGDFDRWLARAENRDRVLPFPRCLVAFQVRRHAKDRSGDPQYAGLGAFIRFDHEKFDESTFLYVRNGERLYRIESEMKFGHLIFPSRDEFSAEPTMFKVDGSSVSFRTVRDHEARILAEAERTRLDAAWKKANPYRAWKRRKFYAWRKARTDARALVRGKFEDVEHVERRKIPSTVVKTKHGETWSYETIVTVVKESIFDRLVAEQAQEGFHESGYDWERLNPYRDDSYHSLSDRFDRWESFDKVSVHYDEALKAVTDRAKHWNRVALVIQGLFDRSECLHPHPPVQSWTPEGFKRAIELIYDGEHVLFDGEAPSFEDYRAKLAESLGAGSWTIGQMRPWLDREQKKERERRARSPRHQHAEEGVDKWWEPPGDDGPGFMANVAAWQPNARRAVFKWERERGRSRYSRWQRRHGMGRDESDKIAASITVEASKLFNCSAYQPGDFLMFFRDPRTRADYVRWAPFLLTAEDWRAGKYRPEKGGDAPGLGEQEDDEDSEDGEEDENDEGDDDVVELDEEDDDGD